MSAGIPGAAQTILSMCSSLWSGESGCCLHHRGQRSITKGNLLPSPSVSSALAAGALPAQPPKPRLLSPAHTTSSGQRSSLQVGKVQHVLPTRQCHLIPSKHGATGCFYGNKQPIQPAAPTSQKRSHWSRQDSQSGAQPLRGFKTNFALLSQGGHSTVAHSGIPHVIRTRRCSCACHHQLALALQPCKLPAWRAAAELGSSVTELCYRQP